MADTVMMPPCPFCGGMPVQCFEVIPLLFIGGSPTRTSGVKAHWACGSCGVGSKYAFVDCHGREPKDDDIDRALELAMIHWCCRPKAGSMWNEAIQLAADVCVDDASRDRILSLLDGE